MPQPSPIPTNHDTPISSTLNISLADSSGLAIIANCTGTPPTTATVFQHGCLLTQTDSGTGSIALYQNTGSSASPVWNPISAPGLAGANSPTGQYFLLDNGSANALVVTAYTSGTVQVPLSTGLMIAVRVKSGLQAGANTINFNGTTKSIVKATSANNLNTKYLAGAVIKLVYTPGQAGGAWRTLSNEGL